mgnify:CR=1 FL=1
MGRKALKQARGFAITYMNLFYQLSDELEKELPQTYFETLDDLNMLCDSYERNPDIRKEDRYCIDEKQLKERTILYFDRLPETVSH